MGTPAVKSACWIDPVICSRLPGWVGLLSWLFLVAAGLCRRAARGQAISARSRGARQGVGEDERA
jgi:hypothetical protein